MSSFRILGLMSGTSLDGLDIADVRLKKVSPDKWQFEILHATTIPYSIELKQRLSSAVNDTALGITQLSHDLGLYFADCVNVFLTEYSIEKSEVDAISSHGHTVFHQPQNGITLQIGNGPELAVFTGIKTVCDFRVQDVLLGGNGAPLVPVGDQLLFSELADSFLNLGGFSNISFSKKTIASAFDICPVNVVLNLMAGNLGKNYDVNGEMGRGGTIDHSVLDRLNNLPFYKEIPPKSLGMEWVNSCINPILNNDERLITTYYEHIATQLAAVLIENDLHSVFITGGGAKNTFLIDRLKCHYHGQLIIPDERIIDFKEATVFALLGALRLAGEVNVWSSVTGARQDSVSGVIHNPRW